MCEEREEVSVEIIREKLFISECGMFFFFATSRCLQRGCYTHFDARRRRHRYASSFLFCARATTSQQIPFGMKLAGKHNSKASEGNHVCALVPIKKITISRLSITHVICDRATPPSHLGYVDMFISIQGFEFEWFTTLKGGRRW